MNWIVAWVLYTPTHTSDASLSTGRVLPRTLIRDLSVWSYSNFNVKKNITRWTECSGRVNILKIYGTYTSDQDMQTLRHGDKWMPQLQLRLSIYAEDNCSKQVGNPKHVSVWLVFEGYWISISDPILSFHASLPAPVPVNTSLPEPFRVTHVQSHRRGTSII